MRAIHAFFEIHMGASHATLGWYLADKIKRDTPPVGECAIFLNKRWTAAKILSSNGSLLYWRSPTGAPASIEFLKQLPSQGWGNRLVFAGNLESKMLKESDGANAKLNSKLKKARSA